MPESTGLAFTIETEMVKLGIAEKTAIYIEGMHFYEE